MWVRFYDMHSGGQAKLTRKADGTVSRRAGYRLQPGETEVGRIYVAGTPIEALVRFGDVFGLDPHNVTCDTCGEDYAIDYDETLEDASEYDRRVGYGPTARVQDMAEFAARPDIHILREVG